VAHFAPEIEQLAEAPGPAFLPAALPFAGLPHLHEQRSVCHVKKT
jgi:hypothetical protein